MEMKSAQWISGDVLRDLNSEMARKQMVIDCT